MQSVPSPSETQQEALWERLAVAAGVFNSLTARQLADDFDKQRRVLFPVLRRNGATIYIGWGPDGYVTVSVYDRPEVPINEYTFGDRDAAACVARALERYWGLE